MTFLEETKVAELVRREEKRDRLVQFLDFYLDRLHSDWGSVEAERRLLLIARSPASPVARVIAENIDDLRLAGVRISAIFALLDPADLIVEWTARCAACDTPALATVDLQWARDVRLLNAHEQLVIGTQMCWSGDSMRRDPEQRDAFELFETFAKRASRQGERAFKAIRNASAPAPLQCMPLASVAGTNAADGIPGPGRPISGGSAGTRH